MLIAAKPARARASRSGGSSGRCSTASRERRKGAGSEGRQPAAKEGSRERAGSGHASLGGEALSQGCPGQGPLGTATPRPRRARGSSCRAPRTEIKLRLVSVRELSVTGTFVFAKPGGAGADLAGSLRHARPEDAFQLSGTPGEGEIQTPRTATGPWQLLPSLCFLIARDYRDCLSQRKVRETGFL